MKIEILGSAEADLKAGYAFYESQGTGLGDYFLDSLSSDIDSLHLFAGIHAVTFERYFRMLSKRFPFAVYYQVNAGVVRVCAVLDCRQDPRRIMDRLSRP